jgi:mannose-6-phosphate isomerase
MTNELYPLKFEPRFFEKPWGGQNINKYSAFKQNKAPNCGEVWLLSGVESEQSVVMNGFLAGNEINELVEVYMEDLVGEKVYVEYGDNFPLLFKILDTTDWLSVQVHPNNQLALKKHGVPFGKTEMWYVLGASSDAAILNGFSRMTDKSQVEKALKTGSIVSLLNKISPEVGDVYFTPAGKIHAIGPGLTVIEIQQASNFTYRLYDWDRTDAEGKSREIHIADGLDALNYNDVSDGKTAPLKSGEYVDNLVTCSQFVTNRIHIPANTKLKRDYIALDSFVVLLNVKGTSKFNFNDTEETLQMGECLLVPAMIDEMHFTSTEGAELLEVYIQY